MIVGDGSPVPNAVKFVSLRTRRRGNPFSCSTKHLAAMILCLRILYFRQQLHTKHIIKKRFAQKFFRNKGILSRLCRGKRGADFCIRFFAYRICKGAMPAANPKNTPLIKRIMLPEIGAIYTKFVFRRNNLATIIEFITL